MPSSVTVTHPNRDLQITFTESDHSYIDSANFRYKSVTTLVSDAFEKFDSEAIAKKKAAKTGENYKDLINEWAEAGRHAANLGTRVHENCENAIKGNLDKINIPNTPQEKILFDLAAKAVDSLKKDKKNLEFTPEKLVFSPSLGLAGSVDLLVKRADDEYIIYDWKVLSKGLQSVGFGGKCGILPATKAMPDSNYWHYALQLQLYEIILKSEGYIPKDSYVRRILNVFTDNQFMNVEMPDVKSQAKDLIIWNYKKCNIC